MSAPRLVARLILLGAALATLLLGAGVMPAAQAEDASWAVRTAANDFGSGRTSYAYQVDPGTRISDALQVANRGDAPLTLAVYAADGFTGDGGQLDVRKVDEDATGLGAWVTVKQSSITIDPDESVTVPFVLTVPKNATPGDYAGGIVTSLASEDEADQISVDRRLGVSMRLRVGGELLPKLTVDDVEVDHAGSGLLSGSATVTYTLRNSGNATLRTRIRCRSRGRSAASRATPVRSIPRPICCRGSRGR